MDVLLGQVQNMAALASEAERKSLIVSLRNAANALEAPDDTMERIMFSVSGKLWFLVDQIQSDDVL